MGKLLIETVDKFLFSVNSELGMLCAVVLLSECVLNILAKRSPLSDFLQSFYHTANYSYRHSALFKRKNYFLIVSIQSNDVTVYIHFYKNLTLETGHFSHGLTFINQAVKSSFPVNNEP